MKLFSKVSLVAVLALGAASCSKFEFNVDYTAPTTIAFQGVGESNIVSLAKGTYSYETTVKVTSADGISELAVYKANNRTGAQGELIEVQSFTPAEKSVSTTVTFTDLTENAAIRVIATDINGNSFAKNLVVEVAASVILNDNLLIETAEVYYGCYYAGWLGGRAYLRTTDNVENYKKEIDIAFGQINGAPCAISPAKRSEFCKLPNLSGLGTTLFALTSLSKAEYAAITKVDASPIEAIADPTEESVALAAGKVYVFKTASGKKGLFCVESMAAKTGTVEQLPNAATEELEAHSTNWWMADYSYNLLGISAKIIK
ncbi:MAG: hypothetical protein HUJ94_02620 [Bacteroidales bacterium]|nr:hypothetical protein [Bacteroidales bacterium]